MSIILKFLSGPLGLYAVMAVGVLLVGSISYGMVQNANAARYQVERDSAQAEATRLQVSVDSKEGVINKLQDALTEWKEAARSADAAQKDAANRAEEYRLNLNASNAKLRTQSEKDRALPDCQKLLSVDLAVVCPGTAAGVRARTKHRLQGSTD